MPNIEDTIKQAVSEAVQPLANEVKQLREQVDRQYPPAVKAKQAALMLGIGVSKLYEMAHDPAFYPAIWIDDPDGRTGRVIFSSEAILRWIRERSSPSKKSVPLSLTS